MELQQTRQQRRAMEREKKKEPTYNMTRTQVEETIRQQTQEQYEEIRSELKNEVARHYTKTIIASMLINLHDLYGFGNKRMVKLLDEFENTLESVLGGYVDVEELVAQCKEEFKIDLIEVTGK